MEGKLATDHRKNFVPEKVFEIQKFLFPTIDGNKFCYILTKFLPKHSSKVEWDEQRVGGGRRPRG